jgi:hypothetical protein
MEFFNNQPLTNKTNNMLTSSTLGTQSAPTPKPAPEEKNPVKPHYTRADVVEAIIRLEKLGAAAGVAFPEGTTSKEMDEASDKVAQERANEIAWNRKTLGLGKQPPHIGEPAPKSIYT